MSAEKRLIELGLELPPVPEPVGIYKSMMLVDRMAYVSGHGPVKSDGTMIKGKVGRDTDLEGGKRAARQTGLSILATLRHELGSLDRVTRVVKLLGMVNATTDFDQHPAVVNGCSELFAELFGQVHGIGVRSAVGMGSLPGNITVEVEGMFEVGES